MNLSTKTISRPDIASDTLAQERGTLDKVGMSKVEMPICIELADGSLNKVPAICDLFVSLDDPDAKGIHMSRLYGLASEFLPEQKLNFSNLVKLSQQILQSHESLSKSVYTSVAFDYMQEKLALKSQKKGWRFYPVKLSTNITENQINLEMSIRITYSSTCPCSAALSRQLMQEHFIESFKDKEINLEEVASWLGREESQIATPHSQRSYADITLSFAKLDDVIELGDLVKMLESIVQTSVQAAVKREDEQEFARLNGANLMFSEDAARRIKAALNKDSRIFDYKIHVQHIESLHPHDAVVITGK